MAAADTNSAKLSEFFAKKTKGRKGFKPVKLNLAAEVEAKPIDLDADETAIEEGVDGSGADRKPKRKELFSSDGWVDEDAELAPVVHTGGRQVQSLSTLEYVIAC